MAGDVSKNLERAKRCLERNRVEDAIEAYIEVLNEAPQHLEATQALGDLYSRINQPDRAATYYGLLFDLLVDPREETKALAIYNRFLRGGAVPQPPERIARYAFLQQKQNRIDEAIEQYTIAAEMFTRLDRQEDALFCWERTAQLEPEDLNRQLRVAETAEQLGKTGLAARAYLRAGQLATTGNAEANALEYLAHAHRLAPQERSIALLYAEATLRAGEASKAAELLEPFAGTESDPAFLEAYGDALMHSGNLDRAREILERLLREKNQGFTRLFELADHYASGGQDSKSVDMLFLLKRRMIAEKREGEFVVQLDNVASKHPYSQPILEFWAGVYNELNRESQYFEILNKLFEVYLRAGNITKAGETLEKLVDIDPYDHRNQERLNQLRGKADENYLKRLGGRLSQSGTRGSRTTTQEQTVAPVEKAEPQIETDEHRQQQALEDLIVQTEIFLQYALQSKAQERLQKISTMFPGEEDRNSRLRNLYETANWWPPKSTRPKPAAEIPAPPEQLEPLAPEPAASGSASKPGMYTVETLRDLAKISEINQKIFRQQTPRAMLNVAVNEVGSYLKATRTLAVIGQSGGWPEFFAEYCGTALEPSSAPQAAAWAAEMKNAQPDELGGLIIEGGAALAEFKIATALGVVITDKETQTPAGMLIIGDDSARKWKPNEAYFLQAVGDQILMSVSHTRLRSLVRRMGVTDERTGLLSRSSYQSCLLTEADRARTQGTPLSLVIFQIDRGTEVLRQQGEPALERFLDQLGRKLQALIRQNDVAVRYNSWTLAFVLPDTPGTGAEKLVAKLQTAAADVHPPWDGGGISHSAGVVEAVATADFDCEDIVTDLINRAEFSMEEARKQGGNRVVVLESPKF